MSSQLSPAAQVATHHALAALLIRLGKLPAAAAALSRAEERTAAGGSSGGAEDLALQAETCAPAGPASRIV